MDLGARGGDGAAERAPGEVALRVAYVPPAGKVPTSALVVITADARYALR